MSDLTKRLRAKMRKIDYGHADFGYVNDELCKEAADRIEALEKCLRQLHIGAGAFMFAQLPENWKLCAKALKKAGAMLGDA